MDAAADLAREAALRLLDPDVSLRLASCGQRRLVVERRLGRLPHPGIDGPVLEMALVLDDRTEALADQDHAADALARMAAHLQRA